MRCEKCGFMNKEEDTICRQCGEPLDQNQQWYYSKDGQSIGPFSEADIQDQFIAGQIDEETLVWQEGMEEWVPMKETSMILSKDDAVWFYSVGEDSQGPVSTTVIISLLEQGTIQSDTDVWKEGQSDWEPLNQTVLAQFIPKPEEEVALDDFASQKPIPPKDPEQKRTWIAALVVAGLVVIGLGGYILHNITQRVEHQQEVATAQQEEEQAEKEREEEEKKKKEEQKEEEEKKKAEKEKENEAKQEEIKEKKRINEATRQSLLPYYYNLGGYQAQAQAVEANFMDNYLKGDLNQRTQEYNEAATLYNTLNAEVANVSYIGVDPNSDYVDTYQQLVQCYVDLRDYVGTYVDAWDLDTDYEKPEEHKDEIMNIVKNSYGGGTQNASLVDYYNRYGMINLEE